MVLTITCPTCDMCTPIEAHVFAITTQLWKTSGIPRLQELEYTIDSISEMLLLQFHEQLCGVIVNEPQLVVS